jgi:DNA-binding Lrp family transcriptional regulator
VPDHVLTSEQLECLASPVRSEVYMAFRARSQVSVAEVADAMGRSPESVHYHVRALARSGLLLKTGQRPSRRKPEALFSAAHDRIRLPDSHSDPVLAALNLKAVLAGLRQAARGFEMASKKAQSNPETAESLIVLKTVARLKPRDLRQVLDQFERAFELARSLDKPGGIRFLLHSVGYPEVRTDEVDKPLS